MISSIRVAENDDLVEYDSICKLPIFWVVMALTENFTVNAAKSRSDYKQGKAS